MKPTLEEAVAQAKSEILEDIGNGVVPEDVATFAELHDYVDANCYGGLADGPFDASDDADIEYANALQDTLDAWIRGGRP